MNLISVEDIKVALEHNYVVYVKYVRVNDNYVFALDAQWFTPKHSQMIKDQIPKSAGSFKLYKNRFVWESQYSTTLHVGVAPDDEANLTKIFLK